MFKFTAPCRCIMALPPKILWPTALLNTWTIITFPKSSFYHTNHTFLTSINVWTMDFWSINAQIKKNSSAQNTILCREWLLQKLTFHHNEITIFKHSQNCNQRTFGEPPAPSVYIYINICMYLRQKQGGIFFFESNQNFLLWPHWGPQRPQVPKWALNPKRKFIFRPSVFRGEKCEFQGGRVLTVF